MNKINTEIVISSLLKIGFDKVDPVLFVLTLGKIAIDNEVPFKFCDQEISPKFYEYVDYNGVVFKIKDGLSLNTNISEIEGYIRTVGDSLNTNNYLIEYLNNLDFEEVILRKIDLYDVEDIEKIDRNLFSNKEIEIIKQSNYKQGNDKKLNLK